MSTTPIPTPPGAAAAPVTTAPAPQAPAPVPVPAPGPAGPPPPGGAATPAPVEAEKTSTDTGKSAVPGSVNVSQNVKVVMGIDGAQSGVSFFSLEKVERRLTRSDEISDSSCFIYDREFVVKAVTVLQRHRFILISGEPESGKLSMAIYLAKRLREEGSISEDTFIYEPHDREVKINPPALAEDKRLQGRILIFRDALDSGNNSLFRFLSSGEALGSVTRGFEKAGCYVIFTASQHTLPPACYGALQQDLRPSLPRLSEQDLLPGVATLLRRFCQASPHLRWKEQALEEETIQKIAVWAVTMSRARQFINKHLADVIGGLPIEEAFQQFDTFIPWFRKNAFDPASREAHELRMQREAWIYCLALVVAQPLGGGDGVPCYEFSLMYESLRRHLLGRSRIGLSRRAYHETELQRLAHAVVVRKAAGVRDVIQFQDIRAADRLWDVLLKDFRSLSLNLIPPLLKLAEQSGVARVRAAQAIGRIGLIDAPQISRQLLRRWSCEDDLQRRSLAGCLAQGALRAGDPSYREYVLACLETLISDDKAWTAVAAYKQLGTIEIALALDKLRSVAEVLLARTFEKSREIEGKLAHFEKQLTQAATEEEAIDSIANIDALLTFYEEIFDDEEEISQALTYALVSLAITEGPAPVLERLARWSLGTPQMSAFVCLVFLKQEGIADYLTRRKVALPVKSETSWGENPRCNAILAAVADDPATTLILAGFLEKMYAGLVDFFHGETSRQLTHTITGYLKVWIRESLSIPPCRKAMVMLISSLLRSPMMELRNRISDWLAADSAFLHGPMQKFAREALEAAAMRPPAF